MRRRWSRKIWVIDLFCCTERPCVTFYLSTVPLIISSRYISCGADSALYAIRPYHWAAGMNVCHDVIFMFSPRVTWLRYGVSWRHYWSRIYSSSLSANARAMAKKTSTRVCSDVVLAIASHRDTFTRQFFAASSSLGLDVCSLNLPQNKKKLWQFLR